jgi:hypothetical protein
MKAILCCALLVACGGNGGGGDDDDVPNPDGNNVEPDSAVIPEGYVRLIGRTWELPTPTGSLPDVYRCARFTVPEDMYITNIIAQAPVGTHHTVLTFAGSNGTSGPDGDQDDCDVGTLGRVMLYASGVGTSPLDFPEGVGVKVSAGQQLHLNLHLFNATDNPISGDTAILVKASSTPPPMEAEMVFAGAFVFQIQPGQTVSKSGGCTANKPFNIFATWPHQHRLGTHHKFTVTRGAEVTTLHDDDYTFSEQNYYLASPEFAVQPGDNLQTTCTWMNDTNGTVGWGESSNKEMCFTGLYRYPALGEGIAKCTDTGGLGF